MIAEDRRISHGFSLKLSGARYALYARYLAHRPWSSSYHSGYANWVDIGWQRQAAACRWLVCMSEDHRLARSTFDHRFCLSRLIRCSKRALLRPASVPPRDSMGFLLAWAWSPTPGPGTPTKSPRSRCLCTCVTRRVASAPVAMRSNPSTAPLSAVVSWCDLATITPLTPCPSSAWFLLIQDIYLSSCPTTRSYPLDTFNSITTYRFSLSTPKMSTKRPPTGNSTPAIPSSS